MPNMLGDLSVRRAPLHDKFQLSAWQENQTLWYEVPLWDLPPDGVSFIPLFNTHVVSSYYVPIQSVPPIADTVPLDNC